MKKILHVLLLFVLVSYQVFAGSITVSSPADGSTYYAAVDQTSLSIFFHIGGTYSGYPYVSIYKFVVKLDGNTVFDSPNYTPDFWATASGIGTHTVYVEMWETNILGQQVKTTTKTTSFTLKPTYNVIVKNDFDGGKLRTQLDGNTTDWNNTPITGITIPVGKDKTLTMTAFDDQTGSDGLLRKWNLWKMNDENYSSNLTTTKNIGAAVAFEANFHKQPTQPTNFQNAASSGNVQISWSANPESDIQYYEIERKLGNWNWMVIATTTNTSYVDNEVTYDNDPLPNMFNVTAYYRIRAKSNVGLYSAYSNTVTVNGRNIPPTKKNIKSVVYEFSLAQNYPNPFNPTTEISYSVAEPSFVTISVYNDIGQELSKLVNEFKSAGKYSASWNASHLPSGVYYYKIIAGKFTATKKMTLAK